MNHGLTTRQRTAVLTLAIIFDIKTLIWGCFGVSRVRRNVVEEMKAEAVNHRVLRERILAQIPDIDAETLADTLEGITDLREIVSELIRSALEDEALTTGLSTRLAEMKARGQRLGERADKKRALALRAMTEAEIQTLLAPDFTASLRRAAPSLEIVAEEIIPDAYWKPQPAKLDRQTLLATLKSGVQIDGATLARPQLQLSVRTK
jgi:Siphovirus Gp157